MAHNGAAMDPRPVSRPSAGVRRPAGLLACGCALLGVLLLAAGGSHADSHGVLVARVEGPITPVMADHLADAVEAADDGGYAALLVEMDTPGGLQDSMRDMVQTTLGAPVPVVVYVAPSGARAASAGAVITLSAHVAAMAPGTNIGAATPVALQGGKVGDKVVEDAAAYARAIAEKRDRNVEFAVDMVRKGRSASYTQARELGVIDLTAASRGELLETLHGRTVTLEPADGAERKVTLSTADAEAVEFELSWSRRVLQTLANPQLAMILLSLGPLAILYELISPSGGVGAIFGGIMLILGFFSLSVLPVNIAGLALLLLAVGLFAAEFFVPGLGVFAAGGAVALVLGGLLLFPRAAGVSLELDFLVPIALAVGVVALLIGRFAFRSQRSQRYAGEGGETVGRRGTVTESDGMTGRVTIDGTRWKARSVGAPLERGERVRVVDMDGLELLVEHEEEAPRGQDRRP